LCQNLLEGAILRAQWLFLRRGKPRFLPPGKGTPSRDPLVVKNLPKHSSGNFWETPFWRGIKFELGLFKLWAIIFARGWAWFFLGGGLDGYLGFLPKSLGMGCFPWGPITFPGNYLGGGGIFGLISPPILVEWYCRGKIGGHIETVKVYMMIGLSPI